MKQVVRSGTSRERLIRACVLMVLVDGFTFAFLWDGFAGYPRDNARQLVRSLGLPESPLPPFSRKLTADEGRRITTHSTSGPADALLAPLGSAGFSQGGVDYYLGPGGHLRVRRTNSRVQTTEWVDGVHTQTDLAVQKAIGLILGAISFLTLLNAARVVRADVTVDEAGVRVAHRTLIPFGAIAALRAPSPGRNVVELEYNLDGRTHHLRLDDYLLRDLHGVIAAICERCGFNNPLEKRAAP